MYARTRSSKSPLTITLFLGALLAGAADPEETKAPPFADGPTKQEAPRPKTRTWTVNKEKFSFTFEFTPGIPSPDTVTEILVYANEIPKTPHPKYGTRVPLTDVKLAIEVTSPAGETVGRFIAHKMPLSSGKYGLHFTPKQAGVYALALSGKASGSSLQAELKLPVDVWPLPKELEGNGDEAGGRTVRRPISTPGGGN